MGESAKQHGKNRMCVYCKETVTGGIVQHYVKNHPDREVHASRLSPRMVKRLKEQVEIFRQDDNKKITGLCYFCEKSQCCTKTGWQKHLILHTGEKLFNCTKCHAQMKTRNEHDAKICKNSVVNVVGCDEDGSLVGYMCIGCYYFQFSRGRLFDHLKIKHSLQNPSEPLHFQKFAMVKTKNS